MFAKVPQDQGVGCRVQVVGCRVQGAGCRVQGAGCRVTQVVRVDVEAKYLTQDTIGIKVLSHTKYL